MRRLNLNQIAILAQQALHVQLHLLIHLNPSSLVKQAITVFQGQMRQMSKNALQVICVHKVSALPFCVRLAHINQVQVSLSAWHVQKATTATGHQPLLTSLAQEAATAWVPPITRRQSKKNSLENQIMASPTHTPFLYYEEQCMQTNTHAQPVHIVTRLNSQKLLIALIVLEVTTVRTRVRPQ